MRARSRGGIDRLSLAQALNRGYLGSGQAKGVASCDGQSQV